MNWFKANFKEIIGVVGFLSVPFGFVADMVYDNGYNKGIIETKDAMQPKIDTLNAKYNHSTGVAVGWKLIADDC